MSAPRHVYQIHIRASAEAVWQALTDPALTTRYFHHTAIESTFAPGASWRMTLPDGREAVHGVIEEVDPPQRLVMTWRVLYDAAMVEEPPSRLEWLLTDNGEGVTRVTLVHGDLGRSPLTSAGVGDGWHWVLGSLKSLLETGDALDGSEAPPPAIDDGDGDAHRTMAVEANNTTWDLLGRDDLTPEEADELLGRAYTAAYHWRRAAGTTPENAARAAWLISRAHATLGHGDVALHHADRCLELSRAAGLGDFDLAYAHEARARALACLGRVDEASAELAAARAVTIADDEDRAIFENDLSAR
ncbi:MAG: SRPBCC family protein [Ilumatobacteraceae bacterium]